MSSVSQNGFKLQGFADVPLEDEPPTVTRGLELTIGMPAGMLMGGSSYNIIWKKDGRVAAVRQVECDARGKLKRVTDIERGGKSLVREYYSNGQKKIEFGLRGDELHGKARVWAEEGHLTASREYARNARVGLWREYNENGKVTTSEHYKDDELHGLRWRTLLGKPIFEKYKNGVKLPSPVPKAA